MKKLFTAILFIFIATSIVAGDIPGIRSINTPNEDSIGDFFLPDGYFNINYGMGLGLGSLKNFTSYPSYRGFSIDGRKFISPNFTVGGYLGWIGFYDKRARKTYAIENGTITGVAATTYYNFTFGVNAHYYPLPSAKIRPYVGLNVGPAYQSLQVQLGLYVLEDKNWQFMAAPELGVFIPFGSQSNVGLNTGVRYNWITYKNTDYNFSNGVSYLQFFIGISLEY